MLKEWFCEGCICFLEYNVYGNMLLGLEFYGIFVMVLLFWEFVWWWGVMIGKIVMGLYVIVVVVLLYVVG